jgi:cytoskeletal protein CcmA (bactofilin family)
MSVATASFVQNAVSSSYALTASYALNAGDDSGIFKQTGSFYATTNDLQISGSLIVTGSSITFDTRNALGATTRFSGSVSFRDDVIVGDDLEVKDETTLDKQVAIGYRGNENLFNGYTLSVSQSTDTGAVLIEGAAFISGSLTITGSSTIIGNITASGQISSSATVRGQHIIAAGQLEGNDLDIITNARIGDYLNVVGNITSSNISASGNIIATNIISEVTENSDATFKTVVYDSATKKFFRTGSYGGGGGGSVPSGTVSSSAQITDLGFVQSAITASSLDTASVSNNTITFTKGNGDTFDITVNTGSGTSIDTGSFITNSQTSSMTVGTASIANFIPFNGNRSVSNQNQPLNIRNVNFGANGLADFINKVYFTNDGPVLDAQNITIGEFLPIGSTVATITATDAEGQAITFGTSSTYTDDFFRINSSTGVVTLNAKSTSSMNTFNDGGTLKAPFPVTATDTFNESGSLTYYIRITPNTAPIWSTVNNGSSTTSVTESIAEDSGLGTDKDRYYFRDTEGDTITIGSGSFSTHFLTAFALTKQSGYVRLDQITSSLDFDLYPTYSFVLTASDEHYESGDDLSSITYLPVRINVTDNVAPSINPQTLTGVNEKSNTGASAGTVAASDAESNTITYAQFILKSAFLNSAPSINLTSSLGGASLQNPSSDPFSINPSTGQVTRKSGQFLNVDIADRYVYTTTVRDNFNPVSASADITIPIANHVANTISISSVANIIETATTGNKVNQASTGLGGSNTILLAANSSIQRWTITSTPDLIEATNITASSTTLQLKSNLSGSATVGGNTITLQITASQDDFDTTIQYLDKVVDVELMAAPILSPSDQTSNLNTNGARPSNNLVLVSITDPQSFTIDHSTWTFTPNSGQALEAVRNGAANSYYVRPTSNLAAGTYGYTASIFNDKGFRAGELKDEFTIAQAPVGSLTTNGTFYIIESALNGVNIVTNPNGRTGTQGDLGVTYSPTYNSAAVSSFASSNAAIAVASNGNLTAGENISGSSNTYPGTITSNITWQDQYGNAGGPTAITVNIAENTAPSATITKVSTLNAPQSAGTKLADVSISDTEGDTPFNLTLGGSSAASLVPFPTNANSSSYEIRLAGNESAGVNFTYNAIVKDNFGSTQTLSNQTLELTEAFPTMYIYTVDQSEYGSGQTYNNVLGIASEDGSTPPVATIQSTFGVLEAVKNDNVLGDATFIWQYGGDKTATRRGNPQTSTVDLAISGSNFGPGSGTPTLRALLFVPSGSNVTEVPTSFVTSDPSSGNTTVGQYVMFVSHENEFQNSSGGLSNDIKQANVNKITIDTAVDGYTDWLVYGTDADFASSDGNLYWRFIPANAASGSTPS